MRQPCCRFRNLRRSFSTTVLHELEFTRRPRKWLYPARFFSPTREDPKNSRAPLLCVLCGFARDLPCPHPGPVAPIFRAVFRNANHALYPPIAPNLSLGLAQRVLRCYCLSRLSVDKWQIIPYNPANTWSSLFWLQLRQPYGFSYRHSRHMYDHSFPNKSCETTSPCSQSMFSGPSLAEASHSRQLADNVTIPHKQSAREHGQAALFVVSPHLGLFHTRRYRPISLYRNLLCPVSQAKKGPERPRFSPHLVFCYIPLSACSAISAVSPSEDRGITRGCRCIVAAFVIFWSRIRWFVGLYGRRLPWFGKQPC